MESKWNEHRAYLEQAILVDNKPYEEIGREFGCSGSNIKKVAVRLGIELPQRRKINPKETFNKGMGKTHLCLNCGKELSRYNSKYCNNRCQGEHEFKLWVERWKKGEESGITGSYGISNHLKRYLLEKFHYKCSKCGWSEINPYTNTIPLEVEHIDGNYQNNTEDNLTILCPNCHSLTPTYKGANRGHGRKNRKKYYVGSSPT